MRFAAHVLYTKNVSDWSKLDRIEFQSQQDAQAENFRKMLLAMARDVRVILIKLADRLHNMRTLAVLPMDKQERIARETLDIYAPIANRLGMSRVKNELEDLAFQYLEPEAYAALQRAVAFGLRKDDEYFRGLRSGLQHKRDRLRTGLSALGFDVLGVIQVDHRHALDDADQASPFAGCFGLANGANAQADRAGVPSDTARPLLFVSVAAALNVIGPDTLYGRYWGAIEDHACLHFECCYHQAIDFAIETGLARVEAGAQGEHKLARGYLPVETLGAGDPREKVARAGHPRRALSGSAGRARSSVKERRNATRSADSAAVRRSGLRIASPSECRRSGLISE